MKKDVFLIFLLLLAIILVVYFVGTSSDILTFAKLFQQLGYFLTGRTSDGRFANVDTASQVSSGMRK